MRDSSTAYHIVKRDKPTMYFVGVTTGQSSIMRLFPTWAEVLGLDGAQLIGIDLPLHAEPEQYRQVLAQIKHDPLSLGALITTHKLDLMQAAGNMFDSLDTYASLCQEVSCIAKRNGQLLGYAKDPLMSRRAMQDILEPHYWGNSKGHVLCLGAGGSGTAITVNLLTQPDVNDRPQRIVVVGRSQASIDKLRSIVAQLPQNATVTYVMQEDPRKNDQLMAELPAGSMVINATGMGKDRPGSPVTNAGVFPMHGIVWELNYRGELGFLHQAEVQRQTRDLRIFDGWRYFVVAWADHIAEIFNRQISPAQFSQLEEKARMIRS